MLLFSFVLGSLLSSNSVSAGNIGTIGSVSSQKSLKKLSSGSELVALYSQPAYEQPIYLLNIYGDSSYNQGVDAAILFGSETIVNYQHLFDALFKDYPKLEPKLQQITEEFMDWQWNKYLSKDVPQEYLDELKGLTDGYNSLNKNDSKDLGAIISRGITLANLPGDGKDIAFVLIDEFQTEMKNNINYNKNKLILIPELKKIFNKFGHQCSMFSVWGDRTINNQLFSARNLDWMTDLGINQYKLITVHHPINGYSHATVGFAGIWGALAGMSSQGLTVHEANLESKLDTFQGFPWLLRLREVMAKSKNINEARKIWDNTNNTVGFNHMIGSTNDNSAIVMETMKGYTAYFESMDNRELNAIDPQTGEIYGYPLSNALYRTNHGYDNVTKDNYQWYGYHAYENSKERYKTIYDYFVNYETNNIKIGAAEAVTVTSAIGIKGDGSDENNCNPNLYLKGANILSVTYEPSSRILYAAFEDKSGTQWIPAACNPYVKIDMNQWF